MRIDWWTLALQAINVLVLIWLLSLFLYKPVLAAIAARQAAAEKLLADAQAAKDRAAAEEADLNKRAGASGAEAEQIKAQALAVVDAERKASLEKAEAEASAIKAQAHAALAGERDAARKTLEREAAELGVAIAGKLLQRVPPGPATEALFQALLDKISALPEPERQRIAARGPVQIVTALLPSDADQARFRAGLDRACGAATSAMFRNDPSLIAGFELYAPDTRVTNSWRADLEAILREIATADAADSAMAHHAA